MPQRDYWVSSDAVTGQLQVRPCVLVQRFAVSVAIFRGCSFENVFLPISAFKARGVLPSFCILSPSARPIVQPITRSHR